MFYLDDLIRRTIFKMGQFQLPNLEISQNDWLDLLTYEILPFVGEYLPIEKKLNVTISQTPYEFITDIPTWISSVTSIDVTGFTQTYYSRFRRLDLGIKKPTLLWEYKNPKLYLEYTGKFQIIGHYKVVLKQEQPSGNWYIENINYEDLPKFIELMTGYTLVSIGKARRGFVLPELPIEIDAVDLVSEGNEIIERTKERIRSSGSKWWLSIR